MFKKYLILMLLVLFSSSLIYSSNCYTIATVESNASIKIVDSKDALIGIPTSINLGKEIEVKNNMGSKIWISIDNGNFNNAVDNEVSIDPGEGIRVIFINVDQEEVTIGTGVFIVKLNLDANQEKADNVTFHARWNNNSSEAKIISSIK